MNNPEPTIHNPQPASIYERSTTVRFIRWLTSWRGLRWVLFVLAWPVTIVALFYAEENWRGRHAWNKEKQKLEARGERLDLQAFIPKPVPDDQNFAAIPFIQSWFARGVPNEQKWGDDYSLIKMGSQSEQVKGRRRFVDLVSWARAFDELRGEEKTKDHPKLTASGQLDTTSRAKAASAVLEGLKSSEAHLDELRAASGRKYSRYPVVYDLENPWGILLPHLAIVKSCCTRLELKACAELAAGQGQKALEEINLMFYLTDSIRDEPFLISYLVHIACLQITVHTIWEGLAEHRWSDAELAAISARLQRYNFIADVKRPLDSERAAGILTAELLYRKRYRLNELINEPGLSSLSAFGANFFARVAPHGWYYQEQRNYCRLFNTEGMFDARAKRVFPERAAAHSRELEREIASGKLGKTLEAVIHHRLIASMLLPALQNIPRRAAVAQTAADHAALACALERYRLANGKFPEKLESLAPQFLPQIPKDAITGAPYEYRREDPAFVLYSVGWNEKDDGGVPGRTLYDEEHGDWVWQYAPEGQE